MTTEQMERESKAIHARIARDCMIINSISLVLVVMTIIASVFIIFGG